MAPADMVMASDVPQKSRAPRGAAPGRTGSIGAVQKLTRQRFRSTRPSIPLTVPLEEYCHMS